jgi:hypothetical protein
MSEAGRRFICWLLQYVLYHPQSQSGVMPMINSIQQWTFGDVLSASHVLSWCGHP